MKSMTRTEFVGQHTIKLIILFLCIGWFVNCPTLILWPCALLGGFSFSVAIADTKRDSNADNV